MRLSHLVIVLIAATTIASPLVVAGELGDPAPALKLVGWVAGDPVVLSDGKNKNVYVIEFWETLSAPCRKFIPKLNELQAKYGDQGVIVIAVSNESLETLKAFVEKFQPKLEYRVAIDQRSATAREYMLGFRVNRVPYTFLVDKSGRVVWHGHPAIGLEEALEAVLAGTYDIESRRQVEQARKLVPTYFALVSSPSKARQAGPIGEQILSLGRTDALLMNELAWTIVDKPGLIKRDRELGLRAAQAAYEASGGKLPDIADTYARLLFENGRKKDAVEYQKKAVELAMDEQERERFDKTLQKYRKAAEEE